MSTRENIRLIARAPLLMTSKCVPEAFYKSIALLKGSRGTLHNPVWGQTVSKRCQQMALVDEKLKNKIHLKLT